MAEKRGGKRKNKSNGDVSRSAPLAVVESVPMSEFTEQAYLNYAMYVILDRALPHIGDGLKPVQRRIIYAMSELGLRNTSKYKKSARTVGDVLGKFHPHGDLACYEAMVLMAQSFATRYPLIDGQGNWGSADDPKSFAAMRYTEARMTGYAQTLLQELPFGTVDWGPNFDGTLNEPLTLPARLPNVLLNGGSGIAVGMSTDIPPHNINEITDALIHLIDNPKATVADLCKFVPAPDYPTAAEIITPPADIKQMYATGNGSLKQRAVYIEEDGDIIVTAVPHQVSGAKVIEQIANQMIAKKLPNVTDLRDESDHENPTRLVITPRSNRVDVAALMDHLFATTDLERNYRVNMNVIGLDHRPAVKNLKSMLAEWFEYRQQVVTRRLQHRLDQIVDRLHILDGLLIAFLNLDEVIRIIREEDDAKAQLMQRFSLSEIQVDAVLNTRLRNLAKLEEMKIREEAIDLEHERDELEELLGSKARLKTLIKKELRTDAKTYGNERCSPLVVRAEAKAMAETDLIPSEPVTVVLSQKGWVRAAKGHDVNGENLNYKSSDGFLAQALGRSNQSAIFLDSSGRAYGVLAHGLPSARSLGDPLTKFLKPSSGAAFVSVIMGDPKQFYLLASSAGYGFVTNLENLFCKNRAGKSALTVPAGAKALLPAAVNDLEQDLLAVVSQTGYLILYPVKDLPMLARGKGNKMLNIASAKFKAGEDSAVACTVITPKQTLLLKAGKRELKLKPKDWKHFMGERGQKGKVLPRGMRRVEVLQPVG